MLLPGLCPRGGAGPTVCLHADGIADPWCQRIAVRTPRIALPTRLPNVIPAHPVALHLADVGPRRQSIILLIMVSPLPTSVVVRTLARVVLLSQRGILIQAFPEMGLPTMGMIHVEGAVLAGLTRVVVGCMVVSLMSSSRRIAPNLCVAAAGFGTSRLRQLLEITLPLSLPGVPAGALPVFILGASAHAAPSLPGGLRLSMPAVEVCGQAITFPDWPRAAAIFE
jgi:putative spermidine/putrescine transport system permease protein